MSTHKSMTVRQLEELAGGPLTLGRFIASIRKGEEMSQVELARKLGVSRSYLCDIEKDRKAVSAAKAAELARALGYSERQLVQLALQGALERAGLQYQVALEPAPAPSSSSAP